MAGAESVSNAILEEVVRDCFWGDYSYTVDDIRKELASDNERFHLLLFTKILDNSSYPSKYIRALFTDDEVRYYLSKVPERPDKRAVLRRQLLRANVLGDKIEIKALKWLKQ